MSALKRSLYRLRHGVFCGPCRELRRQVAALPKPRPKLGLGLEWTADGRIQRRDPITYKPLGVPIDVEGR